MQRVLIEKSRGFGEIETLVLSDSDRFNTFGNYRVPGATFKSKYTCKGKCNHFTDVSRYPYAGMKYCTMCEYYIHSGDLRCACCKVKYRTRRRHKGFGIRNGKYH